MAPLMVATAESELFSFFAGSFPWGEEPSFEPGHPVCLGSRPTDTDETVKLPLAVVNTDIACAKRPSFLHSEHGELIPAMASHSSPEDLPLPWRLIRDPMKVDVSASLSQDYGFVLSTTEEDESSTSDQCLDEAMHGKNDIVSDEEVCNVMIKNIPCRCSKQDILDAIEELGFGAEYNFFHMPVPRGQAQNIGYAFIGFNDKDVTARFASAMTGYRFLSRNSTKSCIVVPARIQGMKKNLDYCQKRKCNRNRPTLLM